MKNDPGYASRHACWRSGPTLVMDVRGLLNVNLLAQFRVEVHFR